LINKPVKFDKDEAIYRVAKFLQSNGIVVTDIKRDRISIGVFDDAYKVDIGNITFVVNTASDRVYIV